jgi:hypothetical protein
MSDEQGTDGTAENQRFSEFDTDVSYADAIEFVFGDDSLPTIHDELQSMGGTVAEDTCNECNGTLYELEYEVVCGRCSMVLGSGSHSTSDKTQWDYFHENRSTYHNSNKHRCVGGFPHVYEWTERDEVDQPIKKLHPDEFYK